MKPIVATTVSYYNLVPIFISLLFFFQVINVLTRLVDISFLFHLFLFLFVSIITVVLVVYRKKKHWVFVERLKHDGKILKTNNRPTEFDKVSDKLLNPCESNVSIVRGWIQIDLDDFLGLSNGDFCSKKVTLSLTSPIYDFPNSSYIRGRPVLDSHKTLSEIRTLRISSELLVQMLCSKNTCYSSSPEEARTKLSLMVRGKPLVYNDRWAKLNGSDVSVNTSHIAEHLIACGKDNAPRLEGF